MKKLLNIALAAIVMTTMNLTASAQKSAKIESVTFKLEECCPECVKTIEKTIPFEKGVKDMSINSKAATVTLKFDATKTNKENLVKAFKKIKMNATEVKMCCKDASKVCDCKDGACPNGKCDKDAKKDSDKMSNSQPKKECVGEGAVKSNPDAASDCCYEQVRKESAK